MNFKISYLKLQDVLDTVPDLQDAFRFDKAVAAALKHIFFDIVDMLGEESASPDVRGLK